MKLPPRILATFPGRAGDIIWALPTVRAIAEHFNTEVDLQIAGEFAPMVDLLLQQPYLAGVIADPRWSLTPPDDWKAPELPQRYDHTYHLGYRGWPEAPLPVQIGRNLYGHPELPVNLCPDLLRPWITVRGVATRAARVAVGFTEAWFELKVGLLLSVDCQISETLLQLTPPHSRWETEFPYERLPFVEACGWVTAAQAIAASTAFLGDCSALHVLAVALGKPCVIMEPMPERLNPIFWPLGQDGPQVTLVRGLDGQATFDARHTAETLEQVLHGR